MEFTNQNKEKRRNAAASTSNSSPGKTEPVLQRQPLMIASELPVNNGDSDEIEVLHVGASRSDRLRLGLLLIKKAKLQRDCKNLEVMNVRLNQILPPPEGVAQQQPYDAKLEKALQEVQRLKGIVENLKTTVNSLQGNGIPVEFVFMDQATSNEAAAVTNELVPIATFNKPAQGGISPSNGSETVGDDLVPGGIFINANDDSQVDERMDVDQVSTSADIQDAESNEAAEIATLPSQVTDDDYLNQNSDNQQEMDVDSSPAGSNENVRSSTQKVAESTPGPSGVKNRKECQICNLKFPTVEEFLKHLLSPEHLKKVSNVTKRPIKYPFRCKLCKLSFASEKCLKQHKKTRIHQKNSAEQGIKVPVVDPYRCEVCDESFTRLRSLRNHNKTALHWKMVALKHQQAAATE